LKLDRPFVLNNDTVAEFITKININNLNTNSSIIGTPNYYGLVLTLQANGKLLLNYGIGGSDWTININGSNILSANTDYYIRLNINKGSVIISHSTDNINYIEDIYTNINFTEQSLSLCYGIGRVTANYLRGTIDLNRSYIKIDDTKYKLQAVVGYRVVGSPTITDGVVSGFSYDNYLTVHQPTSGIVEFVFKIKYVSTGSGQCLYRIIKRGSVEQLLRIESNNKITFTNNIKDLNSATILSDNTNYWLKLIYNPGNSISLSLSTNGTDYTLEDEAVGDVVALSDTEMTIGGYRLDTYMYKNFAGSIDLNNTYIKINNKLWFNGLPQ
jgi:hypothetical protein